MASDYAEKLKKWTSSPTFHVPQYVTIAVLEFMDTHKPSQSGAGENQDKEAGLRGQTDPVAWGEFLAEHRDRLRKMIALRLDDRLRARVDPSDVLQEAFLEATSRRESYASEPEPMSPYLWLRFITLQRLQTAHRTHLGTRARDAGREVSIQSKASPMASSAAIAAQLLGRETRASEVAVRAERKLILQDALNTMDELDREVLALRHFEQLSNGECARVLGINESAATKRYIRALKRLKEILSALPGTDSGFWQ